MTSGGSGPIRLGKETIGALSADRIFRHKAGGG